MDVPPSPNAQAYERIEPSGSKDGPLAFELENATGNGAMPLVGVADALATGNTFGGAA